MGEALNAPGLGEPRRKILDALKRDGPSRVARLSEGMGLNVETVREHLSTLERQGLACRVGTQSHGPGRPEVLYGLTAAADELFPSREAEVLRHLAQHMVRIGQADVLRDAFDAWIAEHREAAMERLHGLEGRERLDAVTAVLNEMGFMAELDADGASLTLCHCPLSELVDASRLPCRAEISLVSALLGERLERMSWIPDGDRVCSYRLGAKPTAGGDAAPGCASARD